MSRLNVFTEEPWDRTAEKLQIRTRFLARPLGAKELGASVHELLPGSTGFNLHAHYGMEELFVILSGTPSLRTPEGVEPLQAGDVVFCPRGPDGMHTFTNPTGEPARVLAVSTVPMPEVVLYPELGKVMVVTGDFFEPAAADAPLANVTAFDLPQGEQE